MNEKILELAAKGDVQKALDLAQSEPETIEIATLRFQFAMFVENEALALKAAELGLTLSQTKLQHSTWLLRRSRAFNWLKNEGAASKDLLKVISLNADISHVKEAQKQLLGLAGTL